MTSKESSGPGRRPIHMINRKSIAWIIVGWTTLAISQTKATSMESSLTLNLPKGWVHAKDGDPAYIASLADLKKVNPAMANQVKGTKDTFILYAFDRNKIGRGYVESLNVLRSKAPVGVFAQTHLPEIRQQLASIPTVKPMSVALVKTKYGNAIHYWGTLKLGKLKKSAKSDIAGWLIIHPDQKTYYTITFSTREGNLPKAKTSFASIISSVILK